MTLAQIRGSRQEMGYRRGSLLPDQIAGTAQALTSLAGKHGITEAHFAYAVSSMSKRRFFDTAAWNYELTGVPDGCASAGQPEIAAQILRKLLVVPDISEYGCSLLVAWKSAASDGSMYELQNLDWSLDTGVQEYPVLAVCHPEDGCAHAVVGFAGALGAAVGGMNEHGIALSEIQGFFGDDESLDRLPCPVLFRDILYHDAGLEAALERIAQARRTNQFHYAVGDPPPVDGGGRRLFTSRSRFDASSPDRGISGKHCLLQH